MPMHVGDAASGGNAKHLRSKETTPAANVDPGMAFLEAFRKLPDSRFHTTPDGLKVATVREGQGQPLTAGTRIKVLYTGWLENGQKFDSSLDHGKPFEFTLGAGRVIKGWEEGLAGMRPGERRQLVIPAPLAYGNRQMGEIPPGSTLVFNVEAVALEAPTTHPNGTMTVVA